MENQIKLLLKHIAMKDLVNKNLLGLAILVLLYLQDLIKKIKGNISCGI